MIERTEEKIKEQWLDIYGEEPLVTVQCTAYNHEKYIENALDSFLSQETDFPFEIVVHDDASTDGTAHIIETYAKKYPGIIHAILEEKNLYSSNLEQLAKVIDDNTRGKFIAPCEGDDYWCDSHKLQMQFDYLSEHEDCFLCVHNTINHDVSGSMPDKKFNEWDTTRVLTAEDVIFGWKVHTSSYFYRRELDNWRMTLKKNYLFGDYVALTMGMFLGDVVSFPNVMSVYRYNVPTGATKANYGTDAKKKLAISRSRIEYLNEYDQLTKGKFHDAVTARIAMLTFEVTCDKKELLQASEILRESDSFKKIIKSQSGKEKLKMLWKYKGSLFGKIWYLTISSRYKRLYQ